jgi:hypothetical protein
MKLLKLVAMLGIAILISLPSLAFAKGKPTKPPVVYTAELTAGAFIFDGDRDRYVIPTKRDLDLTGLEDAVMSRPDYGCNGWVPDEDYPTTKPLLNGDPGFFPIDGPGPWANTGWESCAYFLSASAGVWIPDSSAVDQATWDDLFSTGCPQLLPKDGIVNSFVSSEPNWTWESPGWRRLVLRNIQLWDADNVEWEIRVQLIGEANDPDVPDFLPTEPDHEGSISTTLIRGRVNGRTVSGGGGGRKSCQGTESVTYDKSCQPGIGPNDKMEGFCLKYENWSVMKIAICDGECAILPAD